MSVLVLSGYDASGAAGLLRDTWTLDRAGANTLAFPTCLTTQTETVREARPVDPDWLATAIATTCAEHRAKGGEVRAIKTGLIVDEATWNAVLPTVRQLVEAGARLVVDPCRGPSAGGFEASDRVRELLRGEVAELGTILTPNVPELEWLTDQSPSEECAMRSLVELGCTAVVLKGGHKSGELLADRYITNDADHRFVRQRMTGPERRGTGCVFASFLAAGIDEGLDLVDAARVAGHRLGQAWSHLQPT